MEKLWKIFHKFISTMQLTTACFLFSKKVRVVKFISCELNACYNTKFIKIKDFYEIGKKLYKIAKFSMKLQKKTIKL